MTKRRTSDSDLIYTGKPGEPCGFDGCDKLIRALGLCQGHYAQQHRGEELRPLRDWRAGAQRLRDMTPVETAWLAGLLEGEGCFILSEQHGYLRVLVEMCSTDKDVVDKARQIAGGVGSVYKRSKPQKAHWKQSWSWLVSGTRAIALMEKILPHMGVRRSEKIEALLKEHMDACQS